MAVELLAMKPSGNHLARGRIIAEARLYDLFRHHPWFTGGLSRGLWAIAAAQSPNQPRWLRQACAAARCAPAPAGRRQIEAWINRRLDRLPPETLWAWQPISQDPIRLGKSVILKPAAPDEKGVVFISFETQWEKLLGLGPQRLAAFAAQYDLVLAPSWSPPHSVTNLVFPRLFPGPLVCTISHLDDLETFPRLHPSFRPVNLFASSWVNPAPFRPRPRAERDIELVMVANFGRFKRHHALLAALARMSPPRRPKVTLVGQPEGGRTDQTMRREIDAFGLRDWIDLRYRLPHSEVVEILCRSRAAIITSRREGSCVAVVEAFWADTPVALLKGAHLGSAAFLNPQTGRWLDETRLAEELPAFLAEADRCSPRAWAQANGVECQTSSRVLNERLQAEARLAGRPWTTDIFPLHWCPDPRLLDQTHAALAAREQQLILDKYGINLG